MSIRNAAKVAIALSALLVAGTFDAASTAGAGAAGPWCAVAGGRNDYRNCGYFTFGQCLAAVSGVGTFCQPNPYFAPVTHVAYPVTYPVELKQPARGAGAAPRGKRVAAKGKRKPHAAATEKKPGVQ
jgi:hypothetical protein